MNLKFEGVLFDIDDTLYPISQLMVARWKESSKFLQEFGLDADKVCSSYEEILPKVAYKEILIKTLTNINADASLAKILHETAHAKVPAKLTPYEGVIKMLTLLKKEKIKVGFITNGILDRQHAKVKALGLNELCDTIIVCDGVNKVFKPELKAFTDAAEMLNVSLEKICMVGDRPDNDLKPALKLGMGAIRLHVGNHKNQVNPEGLTYSSSKPTDVWEYILKNTSSSFDLIPAPRNSKENLKLNKIK